MFLLKIVFLLVICISVVSAKEAAIGPGKAGWLDQILMGLGRRIKLSMI